MSTVPRGGESGQPVEPALPLEGLVDQPERDETVDDSELHDELDDIELLRRTFGEASVVEVIPRQGAAGPRYEITLSDNDPNESLPDLPETS